MTTTTDNQCVIADMALEAIVQIADLALQRDLPEKPREAIMRIQLAASRERERVLKDLDPREETGHSRPNS
jgi:hypothetical protein